MQQDAAAVAALIAKDLGLQAGQTTYHDCLLLCEKFGEMPYISKMLPRKDGGMCFNDGQIIFSAELSHKERSMVLIHELAHRLCFSERYEYLNGEFAHKGYCPCLFWEYVARAVEQEFIKIGGYQMPHKHSLDTYPLI